MGKVSKIQWCDATWNPWRGCTKVSAGCKNCYAERLAKRFKREEFGVITRSKTTFYDPLRWEKPLIIFVGSLSDFAHEDVPLVWVDEAWEIMRTADQHTYLILTKRPNELKQLLPDDWGEGYPNIWMGVSVENDDENWRLVALEEISAVVRFVSAEPLLGPLDVYSFSPTLDWVIVGGESGLGFRIMREEWALDIRDQCAKAGIPFFFKQWSGIYPMEDPRGMMLDGREWTERPDMARA
ncbi:hypothetical protein ES705_35248 [subsurface metagenome]